MSDFTIRSATTADYIAIQNLNRDELGYDYPAQLTVRQLVKVLADDAQEVFVADLDGEVVGYIHAAPYDTLYTGHMKNIISLAVSTTHKRLGVGKALLARAEEWAKETGAVGIRLNSSNYRTAAHRFYEACGYEETKTQKNFRKLF